jgi:hypothetical protein
MGIGIAKTWAGTLAERLRLGIVRSANTFATKTEPNTRFSEVKAQFAVHVLEPKSAAELISARGC